ncbi:MAG: Zn-ribbon domain-containing OB-fold protein [Deltaproteobacteria bacterium]|nr:Zn-ribbon domain-containing OB-fold protein [Deltaproteobacteria bacterium]
MADLASSGAKLPIVPFLKIPDGGDPYLEGQVCSDCGAIFLGERIGCAKCGATGTMEAKRLSDRGELYVYSIVFRSFPGIDVPYVSAIVDLEGGGTVKGNLINVDFDPEKISMGMPVEVVYQTAPRKDSDGNEYLMYSFQPRV